MQFRKPKAGSWDENYNYITYPKVLKKQAVQNRLNSPKGHKENSRPCKLGGKSGLGDQIEPM